MSAVARPLDPPAPSQRRPQLRLVPPVSFTRRWLVLALLLAALGVFGMVSLYAAATQSAFRARELQQEVDDLSLRAEELRAEVATIESPANVRRVATEQLGMVPATDPAYLVADTAAPQLPVAMEGGGSG
jgi:cell division protein FtsL